MGIRRLFQKPAQATTNASPEPEERIATDEELAEVEAPPGFYPNAAMYPPKHSPLQSPESTEDEVRVYKDEAGEYRWKRVAQNGNIVSDSSEGYKKLSYAMERARDLNVGIEPRFILGEKN